MTASPYDAPLSALREHVEDVATWLAVWDNRTEPDAHARRCASDAVSAIDGAIKELHKIRQQLVGEIRASDNAAAIRADKLLARTDDTTKLPEPDRAGTEEDRALGTPGLE